ncbi:hypothetical protein NQ314_000329 [Rhamnusium bicolor]|uniref:Uncharacterized protein n=1 Tax=Rhamnusium bicolor TaxID=1586634 RepID=A0AAV8ZXE7_9CUCU|nr:hypothetical protein NQ314_000329 [Rhamnusium bicolor]
MRLMCRIFVVCVLLAVISNLSEARRRKKNSKAMILRQKETNPINFIRLAAMRLIYGIATRMGLGEQISEALNGAFVPPGAEDYDEGGFFDRDDDDYDY